MANVRYIPMFPLRQPQNDMKRLLYLIRRARNDTEQLIEDLPPRFKSHGRSIPGTDPIEIGTGFNIDTTTGTATSYGDIAGTPDGSLTTFNVQKTQYKKGSMRLWMNSQLQTKGTDYTESDPGQGQFNFTTAPLVNSVLITAYNTNDTDDGLIDFSSDSTAKVVQIVGTIDGANTDYEIPPYVSGKCWVELNGMTQTQGTGEDWIELDNTAGTIRYNTAPIAGSVLGGAFVPLNGGYINENTDGALTYTFDGSNTTGTTSWAYAVGSLQLRWNGQELTPGLGFIETDQENGTWDVTTAKANGVISAHYRIWDGGPGGGIIVPVTKTGNYTATTLDKTIAGNATGGAITITGPTAPAGHRLEISKIDSSTNAVKFDPVGAATINGASDFDLLRQWESIVCVNLDGTDWITI